MNKKEAFLAMTEEQFRQAVARTPNRRTLAKELGLTNQHYSLLKIRLDSGEYDTSHWTKRADLSKIRYSEDGLSRRLAGALKGSTLISERAAEAFLQKIAPVLFIENSPLSGKTARGYISQWNKKFNWLKYECQLCGNTGSHNGRPLVLQIDHINGVGNDHRLVNLRYLCPNCHSQTDTFTGRNIRKGSPK